MELNLVEGYRGAQVCKIVGISYRQLDYWARTGLLVPSVDRGSGTGRTRLYSYLDIVGLKVIKRLLDAGVSLRRARKAIDCLESILDENLSSVNIVMTDASAILVRSRKELINALQGGQGVFNVLPLEGVIDEVDTALVTLENKKSLKPGQDIAHQPSLFDVDLHRRETDVPVVAI